MRWGFLALLLLLALGCQRAAAQCTVSAATLNFGTYTGVASSPGSTPLTVDCTNGTAYYVSLGAGTGAGATTTTRQMTGPNGATLSYQLFQDAARSINFGNTHPGDTEAGTGTGAAQTVPVYPTAAGGQYVAPGTYNDSVAVTVTGASVATTTMTVIAVVQATCLISATNMAFGTYIGTVTTSTSTLTITCTNTTPYNVGLSVGTAAGATVTTRQMTGPNGALVNYGLFQDTGHSVNWGQTVGTDTVAGTGTGAAQALTVYGQIPAGQFAQPGAYADTIVATITY